MIPERYRILGVVGQGGMGTVYRAYDRIMQRDIAMKQWRGLSPLLSDTTTDPNTPTAAREKLAHEFQCLAQLRHPHILPVIDYGFDAQHNPFYTMPLLTDATDFVTYSAEANPDTRYQLIAQLLEALVYLHRRGIIHRDLKPDNVLVTADGNVQVLDFGLAIPQQALQPQENLAGTLPYIAPEIIGGATPTTLADIWSVGVMVYQVWTGHTPTQLQLPSDAHLPRPSVDFTLIDAEIARWLRPMLAANPTQRCSAQAALQMLNPLAGRTPSHADQRRIRESVLQTATFVGREHELATLTHGLSQMMNGDTNAYLIGGESGIGKSRLLHEFSIAAQVSGALVVRGYASEDSALPFQVWRQIVRRLLLSADLDAFHLTILHDLVPDMPAILERDIPRWATRHADHYLDLVATSITTLVQAVNQPLVILLEDLQWAAESLAPLQQLLQTRAATSHLMIVASYRSDDAPHLQHTLDTMAHLPLARLDEAAITEIAASMLGEDCMQPDVLHFVQTETEGNPYFIVEAVRALAEEAGDLHQISAATLPTHLFTGGMQTLIQRRLRHIDKPLQPVQRLAAIIGREIDEVLLQEHFTRYTVQAWLTLAAEYAVIAYVDEGWRFAHDKLRHAIVQRIPADEKATLHRDAALAIEARYPDDPAYADILHEHWHHAKQHDRAAHYVDAAIRQLTRQAKYPRAVQVLERSLELSATDDEQKAQWLNQLASIHILQGAYANAARFAENALISAQHARAWASAARSHNILGKVAIGRGHYRQAVQHLSESIACYPADALDSAYAESLTSYRTLH